MKSCSVCSVVKSFDSFHRNGNFKDGRLNVCSDCRNLRRRIEYVNSGDTIRLQNAKWRANNPEKLKSIRKTYRTENREKVLAATRRWVSENPDRKSEADRLWRKKNPDRTLGYYHAYRAKKAGILFTVRVDSDVCGVCQEQLTYSHHPDPMSTSIGHEPPLDYATKNGWLVVCERPEHLQCNLSKGNVPDMDMSLGFRS